MTLLQYIKKPLIYLNDNDLLCKITKKSSEQKKTAAAKTKTLNVDMENKSVEAYRKNNKQLEEMANIFHGGVVKKN